MNSYKKILSIVVAIALLIATVPFAGDAVNAAKKKAKLKSKKMTVLVGKKATIKIKNKKSGATYTFKTNKKKVATVSKKGVVKGIKAGKAKITVKEVTKKTKKSKKKTRKVGVVTVTVKKVAKTTPAPQATEAPVVVPTVEPTVAPTPSPTAAPIVITHEDFQYEGLDTERLANIDEDAKLVALAFDDGPFTWNDNSVPKRIIDTVVANDSNATFFYWGSRINSSTQAEIEYAFEKGCEIANHTQTHPYLTSKKTVEIQNEVEQVRAKLEAITGYTKFLVRPPYLSTNNRVLAAIDVPLISCGVDSKDWDNGDLDKVLTNIRNAASSGKLENSVILMHENYSFTADAVEILLPELKEQGYEFVSVSELAYLNNVTLQSGYVYSYIK